MVKVTPNMFDDRKRIPIWIYGRQWIFFALIDDDGLKSFRIVNEIEYIDRR